MFCLIPCPASGRIVFVALYQHFDFAISVAGLVEDVQLFFECHYQTDPSYSLASDSLSQSQQLRNISQNEHFWCEKVGPCSFVCSGRRDVISTRNDFVTRASRSRSEDFRKSERIGEPIDIFNLYI